MTTDKRKYLAQRKIGLSLHMEAKLSPALEQVVRTQIMAAFTAYWKNQIDIIALQERLAESGYTQGIENNGLYTFLNAGDIH